MIKISAKGACIYCLALLLLLGGWITLYSAGGGKAEEWADKHIHAGLGAMCLSIAIAFVPPRFIFKISYYILGLCVLLLLIAETKGHTAMGAQRWLKIGAFTIQPSEITKIGVILALSRFFSQLSTEQVRKTRYLLLPLFMVLLPVAIILRQPNLGTSTILVLISGTLFFVAGVRLWKFALVILAAIGSLPIIWHFLHDYQKRRVMTFLNPEQDLLGDGYNIMQSKIAIGSGGWYGKGFMNGTQVQLHFLPEKHTDFICTILAEEFGFVGVMTVLIAYLALVFFIYSTAFSCKNIYSRFVCVGVASMVFFHLFINVSMISGLLPAVGIPLPLFSYGRSNLLTTILCLGLVLNADIYRNQSRLLK